MTSVRYYRGVDMGKEVVFDFTALVSTTPRDQMERYFADRLAEKEKDQNRNVTVEIELSFLRETLAKIRAGLPLCSVRYLKWAKTCRP